MERIWALPRPLIASCIELKCVSLLFEWIFFFLGGGGLSGGEWGADWVSKTSYLTYLPESLHLGFSSTCQS